MFLPIINIGKEGKSKISLIHIEGQLLPLLGIGSFLQLSLNSFHYKWCLEFVSPCILSWSQFSHYLQGYMYTWDGLNISSQLCSCFLFINILNSNVLNTSSYMFLLCDFVERVAFCLIFVVVFLSQAPGWRWSRFLKNLLEQCAPYTGFFFQPQIR